MNTVTAQAGFQPGCSPTLAHSSLKTALREMDDARHRAVLWFAEIMKRRLYRQLGYSNMPQYAVAELGFSKTRVGDFMRMARKLEELPAVRESLARGDLGYTKVVEIIKVATPATQDTWVAEAAKTGRRDLARKVNRVKTKARRRKQDMGQGTLLAEDLNEKRLAAAAPVRLELEMTPEQFARFEALMEKVRRSGAVSEGSDRMETLLSGLAALAEGTSTEVNHGDKTTSGDHARRRVFPPPFQIHVHRCPECRRSTVQTSRGEQELSETEFQRTECDARIKKPDRPNKATVPPGRRNEVLRRDRFRCRAPGCHNTRFLEVHHLVPRARGGGNELKNLVTLCSGCHRLQHEGRLRLSVEVTPSPGQCPADPRRT